MSLNGPRSSCPSSPVDIQGNDALRKFGSSPLATDVKALFDAAQAKASGFRLSERRTAIEVAIVRPRMEALLGRWFWVNSLQTIADALTRPTAKDSFLQILARDTHQLRCNPEIVAAKKVSVEEREAEHLRHEQFAQELDEHHAFVNEELDEAKKKELGLCLLQGCSKPCDKRNEKNLFCSRRHFFTLTKAALKADKTLGIELH